jgi:hypothetical protein
MSAYILNPRDSHRQQMLNMVNHYNQSSVGTPLLLSNTTLTNLAEKDAATGKTGVRLVNTPYPTDFVDVDYFRLQLSFIVDMDEDAGDFSWYTPDEWDADSSPAQAVTALKAAAVRQKVDLDQGADSVQASRVFDSYVWQPAVEYVMPRHFSEEITVTDLNGFVFEPIAAASVVD